MIKIAPSLLACDFSRIGDEVRRVEEGGADWLHLDVMDGHFVPNMTIGPPVIKKIHKAARIPLDVHVMITDPLKYADAFLEAGAATYTFHVEASDPPQQVIERVHAAGRRAGLALSPDTGVAAVEPFLDQVDMILAMTVHPGFGGQKFIQGVLAKVRAIRVDLGYRGDIEVDGGIDPETIGAAAEAGANVFVAGTAVFGAADVPARISEMRALAVAGAAAWA